MPINICFCIDENYVHQLNAVLYSLVESNIDNIVNIYIVTSLVSNESKSLLRKSIREASLFKMFFIDLNNDEIMELKAGGHISSATYIRFELPELLTSLQKVLYLDSDIIIEDDLIELWNTDLDQYYVAAVDNPCFNRYDSLEMSASYGYFNAGVLLINLSKWRTDDIKRKAITFLNENKKSCKMYDQDALNGVLKGNWKKLPIRWNLQTIFLRKRSSLETYRMEIKLAFEAPGIIHYSSSSKPWAMFDPHPLSNNFRRFFKGNLSKPKMRYLPYALLKFIMLKIFYFYQIRCINLSISPRQ